jgi:uncharacterized membrane protein YfcA
MLKILCFLLAGFGATTLGALVGLGGGFIIMPILLLLYPEAPKESLTAISLCAIFVNALFSTLSYLKQDKIRIKAGVALLIATLPGAILGSLATSIIAPSIFNTMMGLLLAVIAILLILKRKDESNKPEQPVIKITPSKIITIGIPFSFLTGFISSFFGIGGGIINMPVLMHILKFPVKYAVATSMFIILIMTFTGASFHIIHGTITSAHLSTVLPLCIGSLIGGIIGAELSKKIHNKIIVVLLALCLLLTGLKLIFL